MRALRGILAVVALALAVAAGVWALGQPWFLTTERWFNVFAVLGTLAALVAVIRDDADLRARLAAVLLLGAPAIRVGELCGTTLPYVTWDHGPVATITSITVLVTVVGLWQRRLWARWVGLGGSLAGLGGSVLNGLGTLADPGLLTWGHACAGAGCGALVLLLSGTSMRDAFEGTPSEASLWRSPEPVVRALRWSLITTLVSAPMLIVYALVQPIVPGTRELALALAGLQLAATLLCVRRKLVGAVLLALTGTALLAFTVYCASRTHVQASIDPWTMTYYAVFWVPAGVVSLVAGAVLLRPVVALLRR